MLVYINVVALFKGVCTYFYWNNHSFSPYLVLYCSKVRWKCHRCNELEVQRYKNKLSDPFLDRIDINIVMTNVSIDDKPSLSSKQMHQKVIDVHHVIKKRGQSNFTAKLTDKEIDNYCIMDDEAKSVLDTATLNFALSFRSIKKVQKISRTIADIDGSEFIQKSHVLEALSYRRR